MGSIDAGAPPERKLTDKEYLALAANERRGALCEVLSLLAAEMRDPHRRAISSVEMDRIADALDHYIARSSQGWCR